MTPNQRGSLHDVHRLIAFRSNPQFIIHSPGFGTGEEKQPRKVLSFMNLNVQPKLIPPLPSEWTLCPRFESTTKLGWRLAVSPFLDQFGLGQVSKTEDRGEMIT